MIHTSRQLKALVRNRSRGNSTQAQIIIRHYMMERFLERLALSEYRRHFILKGGVLISAMVGMHTRSTMDIDATAKNFPVTVAAVQTAVKKIIATPLCDGVSFTICSVVRILDEAKYGGIRISLEATFDGMIIPFKIDISTGDVVTPQEISYQFKLMFEERYISLLAYNLETVLSEKLETAICRSTANTRLRDFYDLYILPISFPQEIHTPTLQAAFRACCEQRQTLRMLSDGHLILREIDDSVVMQNLWTKYQKKYHYAQEISWNALMCSIRELFERAT